MVLCLSTVIINVWELGKVRFSLSVQQSESQIVSGELQRVADGRGELEWT